MLENNTETERETKREIELEGGIERYILLMDISWLIMFITSLSSLFTSFNAALRVGRG